MLGTLDDIYVAPFGGGPNNYFIRSNGANDFTELWNADSPDLFNYDIWDLDVTPPKYESLDNRIYPLVKIKNI